MSSESANIAISELSCVAPELRLVQFNNTTLLGAPLFVEALPSALEMKVAALKHLTSNLGYLHAHDALYLLKNCLAIPKLLHLLRCSPMWKTSDQLQAFDEVLQLSLESICNIRLDDNTCRIQATLATSKSGLGIHRSVDLSLPTFLSSSQATLDLVTSILPTNEPNCKFLLSEAIYLWEERCGRPIPPQQDLKCQRVWDEALVDHVFHNILETTTDTSSRACLLAVSTKESGACPNVLPAPHLGRKLDNDSIRIATGLRLGADVVVEHSCICGRTVDSSGHHVLSCRRSGGRISRHQTANETIRRALVTDGIPAILEPVGVSREDVKRPDGMTLTPWESGRPLLWDFTCSDTFAASNLTLAVTGPGVVAEASESLKCRKYASLVPTYIFAPVGVETMGSWGLKARELIRKICRRVPVNLDQRHS